MESGTPEKGKVSIVTGMTDIVAITRSFDAMGELIEAFKQMERSAATDVGKVH
ncbi:MAG: hypothetical protein HRU17_01215 [Polyangiaceae bacterium]|nr:hypothetical protein [Polyangiaceae bacterium]